MPIALNICALSCWAPNATNPAAWSDWFHNKIKPHGDTPPDLAHIKPMQRRRLSLMARAVFRVGGDCLERINPVSRNMASLFATTYGQAASSVKMIQTMTEHKPLSPAAFSLSVHNAIAGQFSISHGLTGPSMTAACGREGLGGVFTQAAGLLSDHDQVLVCCFEEPLPEELRPYTANPPAPLAAAFVLQAPLGTSTQTLLNMSRAYTSDSAEPENAHISLWSQLLSFVAFLTDDSQALTIQSDSVSHTWTRIHANRG